MGDLSETFKNLKKLKFIYPFSREKDKLKNLYFFKKDDLRFIFHGVRINAINKIDEYFSNKNGDLKYQLNNYSRLEEDLHFMKDINYNQLISLLPNEPDDLFKNLRTSKI